MKVLVSACLLGENCKYSGGNNLCPGLLDWLKKEGHEAVPVCPEQLGGLPTPRTPAEIVGGAVTTRDGEDVVIQVLDNGPGMPEEVVSRLLDQGGAYGAAGSKGSGIGLRNVHRRIQLTFGREYGLTILSEPDEGTLVRVRLPALSREEADRCQQGEVL